MPTRPTCGISIATSASAGQAGPRIVDSEVFGVGNILRFEGLRQGRTMPVSEADAVRFQQGRQFILSTGPALAMSPREGRFSRRRAHCFLITIESEQRADGTRRTTRYDIDLFKCIYCGFCEEACPVDSIVETNIFEYHFENRGENIMTKDKLLEIGDQYEAQLAADRSADAPYR